MLTVEQLLQMPLGELCAALRALRESSSQLKVLFDKWILVQPVNLALRYRAIALRECRGTEHVLFSPYRELPRAEFGEGVKLFYDLGIITPSPTYVELCQLWYELAASGHHEVMQDLWENRLSREWKELGHLKMLLRFRALLTWRCEAGMHALQAARAHMQFALDDAAENDAAEPDAHSLSYITSHVDKSYPPTIALLEKLRATYLTPAMCDGPFLPEDV